MSRDARPLQLRLAVQAVTVALAVALLWHISRHSYLLFHMAAEFIAITVLFVIFVIVWNTRGLIENGYLVTLGVSSLFIGGLGLLHTLAYRGMHIMPGVTGANIATQLWIAGQFMQSLAFLLPLWFIRRRVNPWAVVVLFAAATAAVVATVFIWDVFPVCYVEGFGLTQFKISSEYVICAVLAAALIMLGRRRDAFAPEVLQSLRAAVVLTIAADLAFTFYRDVTGTANFTGHLLRIAAFYCIYRAIIHTSLTRPYDLLLRELNAQTEELRRLNATKDRLLRMFSHDLRTPFAAMAGLGEVLSDNLDLLSPAEIRSHAGVMQESAVNALNTLNNILDWTQMQLQNAEQKPRPVPLRQAFTDSAGLLTGIAQRKGITLINRITDGHTVLADGVQLGSILHNLLSNAIKFTPAGGSVAVKSRRLAADIELTVTDTGPGINQAALDGFAQGKPIPPSPGTAREIGAGVGLLVCRELALTMHGQLTLTSAPGAGTTARLVLPAAPEA